ncbi:unnamed protein product [Caenorhabditis brenneri]
MPAPLHISGPCEICGQTAHGRHFGVLSCRACAAFFRRAARVNSKSQDIVCEKGNCTATDSGVFFCKACRLKKCYEKGMDSSKFQSDRDLTSSSSLQLVPKIPKLSPPQSLANFLGRPELFLMCEPDKASTSKFIIDCSFLIDKALKAFQEPTLLPVPCQFGNSLEQMTLALEDIQTVESNLRLEFQTKVGQNETFTFFEESFNKALRWFLEFPEFTELPLNVKIDILKSSWLLWIRLEKLAETANCHRKQLLGADVFMAGEGKCMNLKNFDVDMSYCTNYSMDQIKPFMIPDVDNIWKPAVEALVKLEPTNVELNFMLIQFCLNDALKKSSGETARIIEKLLANQADHLHDYYVRTMRTPNYSGRLATMMKIIHYIEADTKFFSMPAALHISDILPSRHQRYYYLHLYFLPMPVALSISGPCKICDQPAHGNHFGVVSCRACAAFFRRFGAKNAKFNRVGCDGKGNCIDDRFHCKTSCRLKKCGGNCVIFQDGRYRCKACRIKKCLVMGMDSSKIQTNRDLISSTFNPLTTPQSLSNFLGRNSFYAVSPTELPSKNLLLIAPI